MFTKLARVGMGLTAMVLAATSFALAETSATPATSKTLAQASAAPTASPNPFTYRGYIRAYDFTRQNAYSGPNTKPNQQTENNAISLHADYAFENSGFSIGGSYLFATPFNGCSTAASHFPQANSNACAGAGFSNGGQFVYQDDTLPGFQMSTLYEAYLQYKANGLYLKGGNQVGSQTWAPASDSRLKPSAYTGVDGSYLFDKSWTVEAGDYWQWECRTCSAFDKYTLLTDPVHYPYPGATAYSGLYYSPNFGGVTNNGVAFGRVGFVGPKNAPLTANLSYYSFSNIANDLWLDAKMPFQGSLKPFAALQYGGESNTGTALVGKISSTVFGLQAGFNPLHNVTITAGFDTIPIKTDTINLNSGGTVPPTTGVVCKANGQLALAPHVTAGTINFPYFLPTGGTGECSNNSNGTTNIYYGGWASPYTDSYATDPLYTTSLTQGMIDRRSPGTSYKLQATFTSDDKRFVSYVTQAWYNYNNGAYAQGTYETDFDALYYFNKMPKSGPYKGFSFRYRYGNRSESTFTGTTAAGLFVYNRFQAEYDF